MNSSANRGRVIRGAPQEEEVFVLGETLRASLPAPAAIAKATDVLRATESKAEALLEEARRRAAEIMAAAEAAAGAIRAAAHEEGYAAGQDEVAGYLDLVRLAAHEGKVIRDGVASQSAAVVARAVALATRRVVAEYYDADPARTAIACGEALRAAAGQEVLSIRVNPAVTDEVQALLVDVARYVRPDEAVEVGGCLIDLRHGTLDATLDARLSLMEGALRAAGGEGDRG